MSNISISPELLQQLIVATKGTQEILVKNIIPELNNLKVTVVDSNQTVHRIETKVDTILETLSQLDYDFKQLKKSNLSSDEKLITMSKKLERVESNIEQQEIEDYYALCQSKYDDYWIDFDELTRKFLPISEILFVKLNSIPEADYSPVVLELCRALENEWLSKVFRRYAEDIVNRKKGNMLDTFLYKDKSKLVKSTGKFAKAIINSAKGLFLFTFGQMRTTFQQLSNSQLLQESPLLKDFYDFLLKNVKIEDLVNLDYMKQIDELINNYRNPSAHTELVTLQMAKDCRDIFPERLNYFESCVV